MAGRLLLIGVLSCLCACGDPASSEAPAPEPVPDPSPDQSPGVAPEPEPEPEPSPTPEPEPEPEGLGDPFAPMEDISEGLTNTSASLMDLLENGALEVACDLHEIEPDNRRQKLLCGKAMFFYESFGTSGVPAPIFDFVANRFDETAPAFSGFGMVPDPLSVEGRPLGVAEGKMLGDAPTMAYTCASCHFGRLPDGRYSVGAPNHDYEYGLQTLSVFMLPLSIVPGWNDSEHDTRAIERLSPMMERLRSDDDLRNQFFFSLLPLISAIDQVPTITPEIEGYYASWAPGTMDFLISPLPVDDGVMTVSKTPSLWSLPSPQERQAVGMDSAMLGWTGGTPSLARFVEDFVRIGGGDPAQWPAERLEPLVEYILSLRAPQSDTRSDDALIEQGAAVFEAAQCGSCHSGPRGSGLRIYTFDEIETDEAMALWGDAEQSGRYCCGLDGDDGLTPTGGIKSPRLVGLWAAQRFLHNGSLTSLDELLCLAPRPENGELAYGTEGHSFGCDLDEGDKRALIAYLNAH